MCDRGVSETQADLELVARGGRELQPNAEVDLRRLETSVSVVSFVISIPIVKLTVEVLLTFDKILQLIPDPSAKLHRALAL